MACSILNSQNWRSYHSGRKYAKYENIIPAPNFLRNAGINIYLSQVALQRSIPFLLTQIPQEKESDFEIRKQIEEMKAQMAVYTKIQGMLERGTPIALYDDLLKRPYMEHPNGRKVYEIDE